MLASDEEDIDEDLWVDEVSSLPATIVFANPLLSSDAPLADCVWCARSMFGSVCLLAL